MIHFAGVCVNVRKWYHAITFFAGEFVSLSVQGMILCYNILCRCVCALVCRERDGAATNM